jgi:uncharacterized protein YbaP (TraB family)
MLINRIKPLLFISLFLTLSTLSFSQDKNKKYPALLWEISDSGSTSLSYLYGTMHVSNKIAFHLSDSFFMAINSVDKVALESDPSMWMSEMFKEDYIKEFGSQYLVRPYVRDFYKNAFSADSKKSKLLGQVISHNNYLMNGMLYRNSNMNTEHEENTYLDMYIFQAGKKLGKSVIGLENFMESQKQVEKSRKPEKDKALLKKYRKQYQKLVEGGKRPGEMLEDAYRRGDLDLLDSLQKMMNPSRNHQKFMLHIRNQIMADNIDSIIRNGETLFSGVGSAHLAGEKGVIEMLREKGYTLRPVTRVIGDFSRDFRDKLEKTYIDVNFTKQTSSDGVFEIDLPGRMFEMPENFGMKFYLCPEMINGTQFNISRIRTNAPLVHETKEYMMARIDSLLYESIPGKILEKERITKDGYPAFTIKNRSRKGDHQRYLIVVTDIEIIVFKVAGTLEYLKDKKYLDHVFNSIKINQPKSQWTSFKPKYGSFSVDMPGTLLQEDENPTINHLVSSRKALQSFDPTDSSYYFVGRIGLHEYTYIEEDSFELSFMAKKFAKNRKYKELKREITQKQGYPALNLMYKDSLKYVHMEYAVQGPRYFLMLAQTVDSIKPKQFFESFRFEELSYTKPFEEYIDTSLYYSVNTPVQPAKSSGYSSYYSYYGNRGDDDDNDHEEEIKYKSYTNNQTDEKISVRFKKFHRFYSKPSLDSFWNLQVEKLVEETFVVHKRVLSEDSLQLNLVLTDTNSNRAIDFKFVLNEGVLYTIKHLSDTLTGRTKFVSTFYDSFKPSADTVIGQSVTINKADLFFEHLFGEDSIKREQALKSWNYVILEDKHYDKAIRMFKTFKHKDYALFDRAQLLKELGVLKNKSTIGFLKNIYKQSVDTPQYQIAILTALTQREDKESIGVFKKLLESETPLNDENTIYYMLSNLHDSLELNKSLYPMLFEFTRYPEYKDIVYSIFADMVDSSVISAKSYKKHKKMILRDAKDELKRAVGRNSESTSNIAGYQSYSYGNYNIGNLNHILLPFCKDPKVQEYFQRIDRVNNVSMRMDKDLLFLKHGEPVSDTVWNWYASKDNYRKKLYFRLKHMKKLELFPAQYLTQESMVKASLFGYEDINPEDSMAYMFKRKANYKGEEGYIYFFKHKDSYSEDDWNIDYIGLQPLDSTKFELSTDISNDDIDVDIEDPEEINKKVDKILERIKFMHRKRVVAEGRNSYNPYGY